MNNAHDPFELLDIINEASDVLEQVTKKDAHTKGLLHKTVSALVVNSNGDHVLVKQASDRQDAGQYVVPVGGHLGAGESEENALKRETKEEIGLSDFDYKLKGRKIFNRFVIGRQENHFLCLYEISSDDEFSLGDEAVEYQIFPIAKIKRLLKETPSIFGDSYRFVLKNFYPDLLL